MAVDVCRVAIAATLVLSSPVDPRILGMPRCAKR
jgi:hypothetical protein